MIRFVSGDMWELPAHIRINTVNCVGVMGAGVALAFKRRYPEMFREYRQACQQGKVEIGRVLTWKAKDGTLIVNFPTKQHWRNPSCYGWIHDGLNALRHLLMVHRGKQVVIPALGCGNGGLDWEEVRPMIQNALADLEDIDIYVFEPQVSDG